jgi:hypothetical protein
MKKRRHTKLVHVVFRYRTPWNAKSLVFIKNDLGFLNRCGNKCGGVAQLGERITGESHL